MCWEPIDSIDGSIQEFKTSEYRVIWRSDSWTLWCWSVWFIWFITPPRAVPVPQIRLHPLRYLVDRFGEGQLKLLKLLFAIVLSFLAQYPQKDTENMEEMAWMYVCFAASTALLVYKMLCLRKTLGKRGPVPKHIQTTQNKSQYRIHFESVKYANIIHMCYKEVSA